MKATLFSFKKTEIDETEAVVGRPNMIFTKHIFHFLFIIFRLIFCDLFLRKQKEKFKVDIVFVYIISEMRMKNQQDYFYFHLIFFFSVKKFASGFIYFHI